MGHLNKLLALIMCSCLLLSACAYNGVKETQQINQRAAKQLAKQRNSLISSLNSQGISINHTGDEMIFIIPADKIFNTNSANFTSNGKAILSQVAILISMYPNTAIKLAAYTNDSGSPPRDLDLTKQWAKKSAHSLWHAGLDSRLLYADGYGACNNVSQDASINRRLELSFRINQREEDVE